MWKRGGKLQKLYDEWIDDIAADERHSLKDLLEHIHHHTDEGATEGISGEWLASMQNLIEIIRRKQKLGVPSARGMTERLYLHWQKDPEHMTPPPLIKSLKKLVATVIEEEPEGKAPTPIKKSVEEKKKEPEPKNWGYWHGS